MSMMVWLAACNWFGSPGNTVPSPVATASITERPRVVPPPTEKALTAEQLAALDELFVRSTELVREGSHGAYERATITFVQVGLEEFHPRRAEEVTVVPADASLPPQTVRITEVAEAELFVQLMTSSTSDPAWLTAPTPKGGRPELLGRATLLHPVQPTARVAPPPADLPEGLGSSTIVAGVDVSGDGFADVITSEHCCDDIRTAPSPACYGGPCTVTWVRSTDGWRLAEEG